MTAVQQPRVAVTAAGALGVLLGIAYTLSPLTVLMLPLMVMMMFWVARGLSPTERRWFLTLVTAAIVARVLVIAGLFLSADADKPFAAFFGDEEMFKFRAIWLRNIGLGLPISTADFIYAVEETGKSQYLFLIAYVTALVGEAPYGVHLLNCAMYIAAALLLYRIVRPAYGRLPAFAGLTLLLFLPSLFVWSISALKEPLYTLLAAIELVCAVAIVRAPTWTRRAAAVLAVVVLALALEGLRKGGLIVAGIGTIGGLGAAFIASRPRLLLASLPLAPIVAVLLVMTTGVEERILAVLRDSAFYHSGHVFTQGVSYRTLDAWYYIDPADIRRMPWSDVVAYVGRSIPGYVFQPLPWTIESRSLLAYLPEHLLWLAMLPLIPLGIVGGLRRDALLTSVLLAHGLALVLIVALTSGNVGTLIRHRGLVLPYLVWLAALGGYRLLQRAPANVWAARSGLLHAAG